MHSAKQPRIGHLLRKHHGYKKIEEQPGSQQWKNYNFDESTGQVYTEQSVSVSKGIDLKWTQRFGLDVEPNYLHEAYDRLEGDGRLEIVINRKRSIETAKNLGVAYQKGAPSLRKIALNSVLKNVSDITLELIQHLPNQLIRDLWGLLLESDCVSFNTWKIFSKCLQQESSVRPETLKFAQTVSTPKLPLRVYTAPITSNAFDFITSLCINVPFPIPELVKLSRIRNLGALEIIKPRRSRSSGSEEELQFGVGDRLMRAWHHAATNEGAFPVLRILKLWNHSDLTDWSLNYLKAFPSLAIFDVRGCNFGKDFKQQARDLGWTVHYVTDVSKLLAEACSRRAASLASQPGDSYPEQGDIGGRPSETSKVKWIPRSRIRAFFRTNAARTPLQRRQRSEHMQTHDNIREYQGTRIQRTFQTVSWDTASYNAFSRIGELRNDSDLARAGLNIGHQAIVGDALISSVPVASFRLGSRFFDGGLSESAEFDLGALSFVRIKATSANGERIQERDLYPTAQILGQMGNSSRDWHSPTEDDEIIAPPVVRMKRKQRTLEDELYSFMH